MFRGVREAFAAFRRQGKVRARLEWSLRTSRAMTRTRTRGTHARIPLTSVPSHSRPAGVRRDQSAAHGDAAAARGVQG